MISHKLIVTCHTEQVYLLYLATANVGSKNGVATSTYNRKGRRQFTTHTLESHRYSIGQKGLICNRKVIGSGFRMPFFTLPTIDLYVDY